MRLMQEIHAEEIPGVIHCYSYSKEMALEFVKMGYRIGVGGVVTFMAPEPHRGTRNDSSNIPYVVNTIAQIKGISTDEVEQITWENAMRLFTRVR